MKRFFIFSLPRSGSAWLSVFLSGPDSYCYHEPTADMPYPHWAGHIAHRRETVVGGVDTRAYQYAAGLMLSLPEARFLSLVRDPAEINASVHKLGYSFDAPTEREKLDALQLDPIHYENLRDIEYLCALWAHLIGTPFDEERAQHLIEMNIQRDVKRFMARHT